MAITDQLDDRGLPLVPLLVAMFRCGSDESGGERQTQKLGEGVSKHLKQFSMVV